MTRMQIELPDPLCRRLHEIAERKGWTLSEVIRKAAEHFLTRFSEAAGARAIWRFPTMDCGGDFLIDPASFRPEAGTSEESL